MSLPTRCRRTSAIATATLSNQEVWENATCSWSWGKKRQW